MIKNNECFCCSIFFIILVRNELFDDINLSAVFCGNKFMSGQNDAESGLRPIGGARG